MHGKKRMKCKTPKGLPGIAFLSPSRVGQNLEHIPSKERRNPFFYVNGKLPNWTCGCVDSGKTATVITNNLGSYTVA